MINGGDTAWVLTATALVMLMTPGLALFYGGLVRRKNVLSILMQCMFTLGLVSVTWVLVGYTLAFGPDVNGWGIIGGLDNVGLKGVGVAPGPYAATIPATAARVADARAADARVAEASRAAGVRAAELFGSVMRHSPP